MKIILIAVAGSILALPAISSAAVAQYTNEKPDTAGDMLVCEKQERAYEALLACVRILNNGDFNAPERARLTALRGRAALALFDFSGAVDDFTEVLAIEPDNVTVLAGRAEALSYQGEHAKAADDWSRIASLKPDDIAAHLQLGRSSNLAGRHDKAAEAFGKVVASDIKNPEAFTGLALALDMLGKKDEADKNMAAALALNAAYYPALMVQAEMAERRGDIKKAIESYLLAVKSNGMQVTPRRALQRLGIETPTPP